MIAERSRKLRLATKAGWLATGVAGGPALVAWGGCWLTGVRSRAAAAVGRGAAGAEGPSGVSLGRVRRRPDEIAKMRKAGRVVAEMLEATSAAARPGVTTARLDRVAREVLERRGARSNFLGYHGFPAVICTSPNNVIVHGIPGGYVLREGDIISLDCGAIVEGYHGDAAVTVAVGDIPPLTEKLLRVTEESLYAGISQLVPGNRLHEVGAAVQTVAEGAGFSVVRGYVGHGIGTQMHEEPQVPNYWPGKPGPRLRAGMVFAVEPMVNMGSADTVQLDDGWTVVTADGSLSAHFEHTVAVTDDGPEILTVAG